MNCINIFTGIIQTHEHKLLAINGMPDHVHVFFGMRTIQSLADLMQDIKESSSKWINKKSLLKISLNGRQDTELFPIANR